MRLSVLLSVHYVCFTRLLFPLRGPKQLLGYAQILYAIIKVSLSSIHVPTRTHIYVLHIFLSYKKEGENFSGIESSVMQRSTESWSRRQYANSAT